MKKGVQTELVFGNENMIIPFKSVIFSFKKI